MFVPYFRWWTPREERDSEESMTVYRSKQEAGDVRAARQKSTAVGASQNAPTGFLSKLIHPRIGARTAIGFGAVLVLTTIVSVVGWNSFGKFADRVTTSDEMSQLAMDLLQARTAVKDFQLRHDPKYVQEVDRKLSGIQRGADQLKAHLTGDADLATVDRVKAAVGKATSRHSPSMRSCRPPRRRPSKRCSRSRSTRSPWPATLVPRRNRRPASSRIRSYAWGSGVTTR